MTPGQGGSNWMPGDLFPRRCLSFVFPRLSSRTVDRALLRCSPRVALRSGVSERPSSSESTCGHWSCQGPRQRSHADLVAGVLAADFAFGSVPVRATPRLRLAFSRRVRWPRMAPFARRVTIHSEPVRKNPWPSREPQTLATAAVTCLGGTSRRATRS